MNINKVKKLHYIMAYLELPKAFVTQVIFPYETWYYNLSCSKFFI